jgi:enoyl-CoA hydratase/carnithine racemase
MQGRLMTMAYEFETLDVTKSENIARVVISNPPANIITSLLYAELIALTEELNADTDLSVVIFKSADPDFFIAHFDVELILSFPTEGSAERATEINPFHKMCERFRTMDKITIAQVEGRVGGGGNELISNMDMRFGVIDRAVISQMEVPLGIIPGGTGTQALQRIIGRARAMEIIMSGEDIDAETAERWGYFNRIYKADEIEQQIDRLANRIASFPVEAVRLAKQSMNGADKPLDEALTDEAFFFEKLIRTDAARTKMKKFMEIGGQTREGELRINELVEQLRSH